MIFLLFLLGTQLSCVASIPAVDTVLTTTGLDQQGFPIDYNKVFSLTADQGVQFFFLWSQEFLADSVEIKWYDAENHLLQRLQINNYQSIRIVDYINFEDFNPHQLVIPHNTGVYRIELYINEQLISITKFEIIK